MRRVPWVPFECHVGLVLQGLRACSSMVSVEAMPSVSNKLQRRCQRLTSFMNKLMCPAVGSFVAAGKMHFLPLRAPASVNAGSTFSHKELEYCGGFFDGDGCVYSKLNLTGRGLKIEQAESNGEVLLRFMQMFGGSVCQARAARGQHQSTLVWCVYGESSRSAASMLSSVSYCKRDQLDIAAVEKPTCQIECSRLCARLRSLKHEAPRQHHAIGWAYFAVFFDAEGCIHVKAIRPNLTLSITQKFGEILDLIRSLIELTFPRIRVNVFRNRRGHHVLVVHSTASSKILLQQLLRVGLIAKRQQAALALDLRAENHSIVRDKLSRLKGNQSRLLFLDAEGCERAKAIHRISARLRKPFLPISKGAESWQNQLDLLRRQHRLKTLQARIEVLRREARGLLCRGATARSK